METLARPLFAADDRIEYFIGRVTDWQEVWSVGTESGWALMAVDGGREAVPLWPAQAYASSFCVKDWHDRQPKRIGLDDLLMKWIPGMRADERLVAVFPTPTESKGVVVSPDELERRLRDALRAYE